MYFNKIHHPANFLFSDRAEPASGEIEIAGECHRVVLKSIGADVTCIRVEHPRWSDHGSDAELASSLVGEDHWLVALNAQGSIEVSEAATQKALLTGASGGSFGVCGKAWMFQFKYDTRMQFYGLGEHNKGFEKSGQRVKFWNTDLHGDFPMHEVRNGNPNPMYAAMPVVIVKQENEYVGLVVNNPRAAFMDLASDFIWDGKNSSDRARESFDMGASDGLPELYIAVGPSLSALVRKLQTLVGRTPLPPLWALGYHQCRWGYAGPRDLLALDRKFREHGIPCDGLWLDIDYMDRYKVFTFSPRHWKNDANVKKVLRRLARRGRRVVPILDPGVRVEAGYSVYDSGIKKNLFCLSPAKRPFIGFVWPGESHFPDFSLSKVRKWWSEQVKPFAERGVAGAWIDMNDPSIGSVELDDMLFAEGSKPHETYHNQYGLGMARATHAGFVAAHPDRRPFLLTRSAFLSSSRYTAAWTGDNVSNWHHLRMTIPLSLGLALSGMPFNGPDLCGFTDDTTPRLAVAWHKACFLFPFVRNHSMQNTRAQEPWALGVTAGRVISHYIRLRYKLLPYLYQQFVAQAEIGEAILRPLFYDFTDTPELPLGQVADQFMIGPALMQAPVIREEDRSRTVILPGNTRWFSAHDGRWLAGEKLTTARAAEGSTPLYVREGSLVPMQSGERTDNNNEMSKIELHCFLLRDTAERHTTRYYTDDGETYGYKRGERTECLFEVFANPDGELEVNIDSVSVGHKPLSIRLVVYDRFSRVRVTKTGNVRVLPLRPFRWRFTGRSLQAKATPWLSGL